MLPRSLQMTGRLCLAALAAVSMSAASFADAPQTLSASPLGNKYAGKTETAVGNLAADAIRTILHTDIAFIAASELKAKDPPIPAGKLSSADLTALISYSDDSLAVLQLTGKAVRQALERAVAIYPQRNLGFLQVSGLKFSFDPAKDVGQRVTSVALGSAQLSDERTYTVAVTNSMANGALGYWKIWTRGDLKTPAPDTTMAKAIEGYLKLNPKIDYSILDRITPAK